MKYLLLSLCTFISISLHAQSYADSILKYREHYKEEFLTDDNSPLKAADTSFLRFYKPDSKYCVLGHFKLTPEAKTFAMPTHSGKTKFYRQYGIVTFRLKDTALTLHVYQSIDLANKYPKYKDYLFIPFTDNTNYTETFGGGRYIDLLTTDIKDNKLVLDFNKCYNPYCAYAGGYSCPIPPKENSLHISVKAGELLFGKPVKE